MPDLINGGYFMNERKLESAPPSNFEELFQLLKADLKIKISELETIQSETPSDEIAIQLSNAQSRLADLEKDPISYFKADVLKAKLEYKRSLEKRLENLRKGLGEVHTQYEIDGKEYPSKEAKEFIAKKIAEQNIDEETKQLLKSAQVAIDADIKAIENFTKDIEELEMLLDEKEPERFDKFIEKELEAKNIHPLIKPIKFSQERLKAVVSNNFSAYLQVEKEEDKAAEYRPLAWFRDKLGEEKFNRLKFMLDIPKSFSSGFGWEDIKRDWNYAMIGKIIIHFILLVFLISVLHF